MKLITALRKKKGWSLAEEGRQSRLHPALVGQIESGRFRPYPGQLARLADALGWDVDDAERLLEEVDDDQTDD